VEHCLAQAVTHLICIRDRGQGDRGTEDRGQGSCQVVPLESQLQEARHPLSVPHPTPGRHWDDKITSQSFLSSLFSSSYYPDIRHYMGREEMAVNN
jgi:hypothetical protein